MKQAKVCLTKFLYTINKDCKKQQQSLKSVAPSRPPGPKNSGYVVRSILEEWLKFFGKDKMQNEIVQAIT